MINYKVLKYGQDPIRKQKDKNACSKHYVYCQEQCTFCIYMTGHSLAFHFLRICCRCPQRLINIFCALRHEVCFFLLFIFCFLGKDMFSIGVVFYCNKSIYQNSGLFFFNFQISHVIFIFFPVLMNFIFKNFFIFHEVP